MHVDRKIFICMEMEVSDVNNFTNVSDCLWIGRKFVVRAENVPVDYYKLNVLYPMFSIATWKR